jgi:hypothetical protein
MNTLHHRIRYLAYLINLSSTRMQQSTTESSYCTESWFLIVWRKTFCNQPVVLDFLPGWFRNITKRNNGTAWTLKVVLKRTEISSRFHSMGAKKMVQSHINSSNSRNLLILYLLRNYIIIIILLTHTLLSLAFLLMHQRYNPPLRLQISDCSTVLLTWDVN